MSAATGGGGGGGGGGWGAAITVGSWVLDLRFDSRPAVLGIGCCSVRGL